MKFLHEEFGIRENYSTWNLESWALGSGIQFKESGIPLTRFRLESIIQVPPTMTAILYLESGIHIVESEIQDCLGFAYMGQKKSSARDRDVNIEGWLSSKINS